MGSFHSTGKDNDELVDNLINSGSIKTERVELIMRLVDRGLFIPCEYRAEHAYRDSAWRSETGDPGFLHLSAPCIYASILENLDLKKGMSFLNVGSGTGYLSSMAGFMIGSSGSNFGIELYENVVKYARECCNPMAKSSEACAFDWCIPEFIVGNAFQIATQIRYDRIYVGALVPQHKRSYFCNFLKINGCLIMPYGHELQQIIRKSETEFTTKDISAVQFTRLIPVNPSNPLISRPVTISFASPLSLKDICRRTIRETIRNSTSQSHPLEIHSFCTEKKRMDRKRRNNSEGNDSSHPPPLRRRVSQIVLVDGQEQAAEQRGEARRDLVEGEEEDRIIGRLLHRQREMRHIFTLFENRMVRHVEARTRRAAGLVVRAAMNIIDPNNTGPDARNDDEDEDEDDHEGDHNREPVGRNFVIQFNHNPNHDNGVETDDDTDDNFGFRFISGNENAQQNAEQNNGPNELDVNEHTVEDMRENEDVNDSNDEHDSVNDEHDSVNDEHDSDENDSDQADPSDHIETSHFENIDSDDEMFTAEQSADDSEGMVTARDGEIEERDEENDEQDKSTEKKPNDTDKKEKERIKKLDEFYIEYQRRIDQLPVNVKMRKFIKHQF